MDRLKYLLSLPNKQAPQPSDKNGFVVGYNAQSGRYQVQNANGSITESELKSNGAVGAGDRVFSKGRVIVSKRHVPRVEEDRKVFPVSARIKIMFRLGNTFWIGGDRPTPIKIFDLADYEDFVLIASFGMSSTGSGEDDWVAGVIIADDAWQTSATPVNMKVVRISSTGAIATDLPSYTAPATGGNLSIPVWLGHGYWGSGQYQPTGEWIDDSGTYRPWVPGSRGYWAWFQNNTVNQTYVISPDTATHVQFTKPSDVWTPYPLTGCTSGIPQNNPSFGYCYQTYFYDFTDDVTIGDRTYSFRRSIARSLSLTIVNESNVGSIARTEVVTEGRSGSLPIVGNSSVFWSDAASTTQTTSNFAGEFDFPSSSTTLKTLNSINLSLSGNFHLDDTALFPVYGSYTPGGDIYYPGLIHSIEYLNYLSTNNLYLTEGSNLIGQTFYLANTETPYDNPDYFASETQFKITEYPNAVKGTTYIVDCYPLGDYDAIASVQYAP